MPYCAVPNCKNRSHSKSKNQCKIEVENKTTFHLFPKNIERRRIWIDRMGLTNTNMPKYAYLCSGHFSPESFDRMSAFKVRLRDDAIPNVYAQKNAVLQDTCSVDRNCKRSEATGKFLADEVGVHTQAKETCSSIDQVCKLANKRPRIDSPSTDCNKKNVFCQTSQPPECVDKATWVSTSLVANSPIAERLRHIIKELKESHRKEIKCLKQTARRRQKRIATLKVVIYNLRVLRGRSVR